MKVVEQWIKRVSVGIIFLSLLLIYWHSSLVYAYEIQTSSSYQQQIQNHHLHITFRVDNDFTLDEIITIRQALDSWTRATGGLITFSIEVTQISAREIPSWYNDNRPTIYRATKSLKWKRFVALIARRGNGDIVGMAYTDSGDIFILSVQKSILKNLFIHEVGHILIGFGWHSTNPNSVMYPQISSAQKIQGEEVAIILRRILSQKH